MQSAILALLLGVVAFAAPPILRPNPADFAQISGFEAEWCGQAIGSATARAVCFGKSRFQGTQSIRSILVKKSTGSDLYVEDQWPGVELLKPRFGVIGPVLPSATSVENGKALLLLNREGQEEGLILETPSLGTIQVERR